MAEEAIVIEAEDPPVNGDSGVSMKRKRSMEKPKKKYQMVPPGFIVEPGHVQQKISVGDLRDLIVYILGDGQGPKWLSVRNRPAIRSVVALHVPGLTPDMFGFSSVKDTAPLKLSLDNVPAAYNVSAFAQFFNYVYPVQAPGSKDSLQSPVNEFLSVPFTKAEKKQSHKDAKKAAGVKLSPKDIQLTLQQMRDNFYPIHPQLDSSADNDLKEGWVDTVQKEDATARMFAMDCEMCDTASGKTVTRATLIDSSGKVVFDDLIKPDEPIVDYLTQWSGITEEMLRDVTTKLADVQKKILDNISSRDFLIGHSLESDLTVLKLRHPRIIDTAVLFEHPKGSQYKYALKQLAYKHLNRSIQTGTGGHNSVEDSLACLDLVKAKLEKGPSFGVHQSFTVNLAAKLAKNDITTAIVEPGVPFWTEFATDVVSPTSDRDVAIATGKMAAKHQFVYAKFNDFQSFGWPKGQLDEQELKKANTALSENISLLYETLPSDTALIVWSGSGDPGQMLHLRQQRRKYQEEYRTKNWAENTVVWTMEEDMQLTRATSIARAGVALLTVKHEEEVEDSHKRSRSATPQLHHTDHADNTGNEDNSL